MFHQQQSIGAALAGGSQSAGDVNSPVFLSSEPAPYVNGTRTPPERAGTNRRKQTLLALIDELAALRDEELEKEREINYTVTKDERASSDAEGIERFKAFDVRIRNLDLRLQAFANAVRQLGSSVGLLNAAYHLRARLGQIQYFFRENAAELFDAIPHAPNVGKQRYSARKRGKVRRHIAVGPENNILWSTEIEDLPNELEDLAKDLDVFLKRLNDVPEFTDEAVNASIHAFEGDLRYRASCLREFEGQLKYVAVARYINDLTEDLGEHMESMMGSLQTFIDVGVPTIRFSQKHTATGLQNLSTVATFFSGVTATTLQVSYEETDTVRQNIVNGLWISSLVFSIASAINSQLAYHWRAAMYRSPRCYVPWWVSIWITRTPLFFLVGSVIAFSAGLCVFTYSSGQARAVSAVVTSFTVVTSSALLCVGFWFASERWTFARTKGNRWLLDILEEHGEKAGKVTGITPTRNAAKKGVEHTQTFFKEVKRSMTNASERVVIVADRMGSAVDVIKSVPRDIVSRATSTLAIVTDRSSTDARGDEESQESAYRTDSPTVMLHGEDSGSSLAVNAQSDKRKLSDLGKSNEGPIPENAPLSLNTTLPLLPIVINPPSGVPSTPASSSNHSAEPGPSEQTQRNAKFKALTKRVIHTFRLVPQPHAPSSPPIRSMSSPSVMSDSRHRRDSSDNEVIPARIQTYVPMLRTLRSSQLLTEHVALVKHLQFSPDGQFLATCSWDRTALIWRVGAGPSGEFELMHKLVHTARVGGFVGQVAWSPNGEQLLTKQLKSIKVWSSKTGVCERTIDRKRSVQAVTWMPKGSRFLSIEWKLESSQAEKRVNHTENIMGSDLVVLGTDGTQRQEHHLARLQVWDAAVVPDEERLVAVATLLRSEQDRRPVKSRPEKRILIYNMQTREIENQVPLLQEVRDITLTEQGNYALVSYENKAPPQAWRIDKILREGKQRLVLAHTYFTKHPVDFAGPSYFGGVKDTFVLAASKSGEIYIWERSSGVLLHSLKAPDQELTNLAWNHKSPSGFMFASAAHDGMVRIWTTTAAVPPARSRPSSPEPLEVESPSPFLREQSFGSPPGSPRLL
ncbi:WD40-repeat-containing domain protein [Rhizoctonia solani]|nr:WD40-repeat-containing domain protein [Rhizoctonia solani]